MNRTSREHLLRLMFLIATAAVTSAQPTPADLTAQQFREALAGRSLTPPGGTNSRGGMTIAPVPPAFQPTDRFTGQESEFQKHSRRLEGIVSQIKARAARGGEPARAIAEFTLRYC